MQPSTVVTRTEAGSAELAVPAHGLSLNQRRYLTLLDTSCTVDDLALRHRAEAARVERDLARLTELGLVVCVIPTPANDAEAASPASVRLGKPLRWRRLPFVVLPVAAAALAYAGWHQWTASDAAAVDRAAAANASPSAPNDVQDALPTDPQPIATRVLKSDPTDRPRAPAKAGETHAEKAPAKPVLPVEHRSPPPEASRGAAEAPIGIAVDTPGKAASTAAGRPSTMTVAAPAGATPVKASADSVAGGLDKRSTATPSAAPLATSAAAPAATVTPAAVTAPVPAAAKTDAVRAPTAARAGDAPSVHVASAAPAAASVQAPPAPALAPASTLVPVARESPTFPREAIALGLARGEVKARVTIDAKGNVSDVAILDASHRAFNRAVREALAHWRFPPGAAGRTTTIDVAFNRD